MQKIPKSSVKQKIDESILCYCQKLIILQVLISDLGHLPEKLASQWLLLLSNKINQILAFCLKFFLNKFFLKLKKIQNINPKL